MLERLRRARRGLGARFRTFAAGNRERIERNRTRLLRKRPILLLYRVIREMGADRGTDLAAAMAYWAVIAIFPLLVGIIAILGLFLSSETVQQELSRLIEQNFPGAAGVVEANVSRIVAGRGTLGMVAILGLLWTGSGFFGALGRAINRAWDTTPLRSWWKRKVRDLAMALGTGVLLLLSLGLSVLSSLVDQLGLPLANLTEYGGRIASFFIMLAIFLLIYKYVPNTRTTWDGVLAGAILAAVLFEIARTVFVLYLTRFANYELLYGNLASAVILLVWIYYSSLILVLGAEFGSEYARMNREIREGKTPAPESRAARAGHPGMACKDECCKDPKSSKT